MNILILSWRDPKHPNAGGAEQATREHAKAWVKAGHEVVWFSSCFKGASKEENILGINIIRNSRQFIGVQIAAFFWYFFGEHPQFDLVIDQFHGIPFFTPFYVKTKKLGYIHEVAKEVWGLNPWPKPFNLGPAILGPLLEQYLFKVIYKKIPFMTVSNSTRDDLVEWGIPKKNINVIYNGVTLALPKKALAKEGKKTAIFLGALAKDKGIEDALAVFLEIDKKEKGWQFWVVGMGSKDCLEKLKAMVVRYKIENKVKFWGWVNDKKKFELLNRAHVLVNPSIREGWGLVNIESNAVETPIVAYDVPGVRNSVVDGKTGVLVKRGDYRNLAESVLKLTNDGNRYRKFQQNGKKWSSNFSWKKATKESLLLIESL
jgi:glycosyltransferase involved in cell wall biosynthesis